MNCPYCDKEMAQGFLTSTHDITWQTKANAEPFYKLRMNENDFSDTFWTGPSLTSWYCPDCNVILANPPIQKEPVTPEKLLQQGKDLVRKTIKKARKMEP